MSKIITLEEITEKVPELANDILKELISGQSELIADLQFDFSKPKRENGLYLFNSHGRGDYDMHIPYRGTQIPRLTKRGKRINDNLFSNDYQAWRFRNNRERDAHIWFDSPVILQDKRNEKYRVPYEVETEELEREGFLGWKKINDPKVREEKNLLGFGKRFRKKKIIKHKEQLRMVYGQPEYAVQNIAGEEEKFGIVAFNYIMDRTYKNAPDLRALGNTHFELCTRMSQFRKIYDLWKQDPMVMYRMLNVWLPDLYDFNRPKRFCEDPNENPSPNKMGFQVVERSISNNSVEDKIVDSGTIIY